MFQKDITLIYLALHGIVDLAPVIMPLRPPDCRQNMRDHGHGSHISSVGPQATRRILNPFLFVSFPWHVLSCCFLPCQKD
jgi:hypothetical protein